MEHVIEFTNGHTFERAKTKHSLFRLYKQIKKPPKSLFFFQNKVVCAYTMIISRRLFYRTDDQIGNKSWKLSMPEQQIKSI